MTCFRCQKLTNILITTPDDLNKIITQLKRAVRWGDIKSMGSNYGALPFSELGHNNWQDSISNYFTCLHCNQHFYFHAETYHGSGGKLETVTTLPDNLIPDKEP